MNTSSVLQDTPQQIVAALQALQQRIGTERLITAANVLGVVLVAYSLADWTWKIAHPPLSPVTLTAPVAADSAEKLDVQAILDAYLFGRADQPEAVAAPTEVPLSSLNLKLTGVVVAGAASIAIIEAGGGEQTPYALGQEITHGAVLHAVYADRVLLLRAGVLESLVLEEADEGIGDMSYAPPPLPTAAPPEIRALGPNSYSVSRSMIEEQLKNPQFLRQAHIVPRKEGGFLVRKLSPGSLYERIGLKQGDVITSVNGEPINSIQDAMNHYQQLNSMGQVQVEVLRNGVPQMLQYQLNQ